jgi:hypothetical protein
MRTWGYIVEIPEGIGGERPSEEGSIQKCERCNEQFQVKRQGEAEECTFHWGKPFTSKANGSSLISSLPILFSTNYLGHYYRGETTRISVLLTDHGRRAVLQRSTCFL